MKKMSKIYEEKEVIVRTSLKELLQDIDTGIVDVYYKAETNPLREEVNIIFKGGAKKSIDVTCDGLYGIAKDVVNKLYN